MKSFLYFMGKFLALIFVAFVLAAAIFQGVMYLLTTFIDFNHSDFIHYRKSLEVLLCGIWFITIFLVLEGLERIRKK